MMTEQTGLHAASKFYADQANIYETFSNAEDKPGEILEVLLAEAKGKSVVDVGCGNGKYCRLLSPVGKKIMGLDQSEAQLELAKLNCNGLKNINFELASAEKLPIADKTADLAISCWVLGTIADEETRRKAVEELKRIVRPGGKIILVENAFGSEFEQIRGRVNDPLERTEKYNKWLVGQGFGVLKYIDTYFEFESLDQARQVIGAIWGKPAADQLKSNTIQHKILILKYEIE